LKITKKIGTLALLSVLTFSMGTPAYASTAVYVNAKSGLNIRKTPNTNKKAVDTVTFGTKLVRIKKGKAWDTISYHGKTRYVSNKHISTRMVKQPNRSVVKSNAKYSNSYFKRMGIIRWNGKRFTWYSQRVLSGSGLKIPGRHVDGCGYVCDRNGYICAASSVLRKGAITSTPFGKPCKIYDYNASNSAIDIYVNW